MPFRSCIDWLFDGKKDTPIPDIVLRTSHLSHVWILRMFSTNANLNAYLNEYFNNKGLWNLDKGELLAFIKKCVADFKIRRSSLPPPKPRLQKDKLFDVLREQVVELKDHEISLLCDIINNSEEKKDIYYSLGLEKPKKAKVRKKKTKKKEGGFSEKDYISENYKFSGAKKLPR